MLKHITVFLVGLCLAAPVFAQDGPVWSEEVLQACFDDASHVGEAENCAGLAASVCMESHAVGSTTMGMNYCLDAEWRHWDFMLNTIYSQVIDVAREADLEPRAEGTPGQEETLITMQRAWIPYRDGLCDYAAAKFSGGTGAGPARLECLVFETARQVFVLRGEIAEGY